MAPALGLPEDRTMVGGSLWDGDGDQVWRFPGDGTRVEGSLGIGARV